MYVYPNAQEPNTLFYHDHALGITRLNVMSGLAGFYLIREPSSGTGVILSTNTYQTPSIMESQKYPLQFKTEHSKLTANYGSPMLAEPDNPPILDARVLR